MYIEACVYAMIAAIFRYTAFYSENYEQDKTLSFNCFE